MLTYTVVFTISLNFRALYQILLDKGLTMIFSYRIIFLFLFCIMLNGCNISPISSPVTHISSTQDYIRTLKDTYVLIMPDSNNIKNPLLIELSQQAQELNIEIIPIGILDTKVNQIDAATIIYMAPHVLEQLDALLLKEWYREHKFLVGLNTSLNDIAKKLGKSSKLDVLDISTIPEGYTIVGAGYYLIDSSKAEVHGEITKNDYYSGLDILHIENTLWLSKIYSDNSLNK